jgi:GNAT superfamily N-acetyltransferase
VPGLAFRGAWRGMIEAVRVARDVRGQRVGARMIECANDRFRARGCRMVQLMSMQSRTDAHRFYERLGWDKSHFGFKYQL